MAVIQQLHFLRPEWFFALVPLAIILLLLIKNHTKTSNWSQHCDPHLLKYLIHTEGKKKWYPTLWLLSFAWVIATIILAGPVWQKEKVPVYQSPVARVIVLDLSAHMYASDIIPSRMTRAKLKITELLRNSKDIENALVVFASNAYVVSPLTNDSNTILSMLPSLSPSIMPSNGNNPYAGLQKAQDLITQAGVSKTAQVILMTDHADSKTAELATSMHDMGIDVSVLGIGSKQGSTLKNDKGQSFTDQTGKLATVKLDKESLERVAKAGGGIYITMIKSNADIDKLLSNETHNISLNQAKQTDNKTEIWQDKGYLFILLLLALAIWGFRKGSYGLFAMAVIPIGMIGTPNISHANETWDNLWQTQNQQGQALYDQGEPAKAANKFNSEQWKGSALYQAKDYKASLKAFQKAPSSSNSHYNIGNTQTQLGEYEKAKKSYDKSLELNPNNQDAKDNLEIVKKLLEDEKKQDQQKQEQQQQQQQDQQQQDQQQQDQQQQDQQQQDQQQQDQQQQDQQQQDQQQQDQQQQDQQQQDQQQQDQQQQDQQQQDQQQQDQQQQDQQQSEDDSKEKEIKMAKEDPLSKEQEQAMKQWLRQIPDEPGTLLQREFMRQYQIKNGYKY